MTWPLWIVFVYLLICIPMNVARIGKPSKPLTNGGAIFSIFLVSILAGLVLLGAVIR